MSKTVNLSDIELDSDNARKRGGKAKETLAKSLEHFGAARSVVMDANGVIRAGNGTVEAAKLAGIDKARIVESDGSELIVVKRTDLEGERATAYAISDNRTGELAEWELDVLDEQLKGLSEYEANDLGFDEESLKELFPEEKQTVVDVEPQIDRAEELQKEWGTEEGQLWIIEGKQTHRLLCGDSTKAEDVERLMGGETADLIFTSPPYGQQREYDTDSNVDVSDWDKLMNGVFGNLPSNEKTQVLVNLGLIHRDCEWIPYWDKWIEFMRSQGWRRFGWYVWDQGAGLPGDWNGRFGPSFEFVWHFNKKSIRPNKWIETKEESRDSKSKTVGFRKEGGSAKVTSPHLVGQDYKIPDSVIRVPRNSVMGKFHSAAFPVGLAKHFIKSFDCNCYEPFLGSGTTMLAAEQLNRRCYGMEISAKYTAVILQRMKDAGCTCKLEH